MTIKTNEDNDGSLSFRLLLASQVRKEILDRKWSQKTAASTLLTTQCRISHIHNLKVEQLSVKSLLKMLQKLGHQIVPKIINVDGDEVIQVNISKQRK